MTNDFCILQCSISECKQKSIQTVKISFKENRNLCKKHLTYYLKIRMKNMHANFF